jgi:hypothetical protein
LRLRASPRSSLMFRGPCIGNYPAKRLPDWEARLRVALDYLPGQALEWGTADCATFAADVIDALTGREVLGHASRLLREPPGGTGGTESPDARGSGGRPP